MLCRVKFHSHFFFFFVSFVDTTLSWLIIHPVNLYVKDEYNKKKFSVFPPLGIIFFFCHLFNFQSVQCEYIHFSPSFLQIKVEYSMVTVVNLDLKEEERKKKKQFRETGRERERKRERANEKWS